MYIVDNPPDELFENSRLKPEGQVMIQGTPTVYEWDFGEYPPRGGIYCHYKGVPFPRKGFVYPEAVWACNIVKRITRTLVAGFSSKDIVLPALGFILTPFKRKIRLLERVLLYYNRVAEWLLSPHFLKENRYGNCPRELQKLLKRFLMELGISEYIAGRTSKVLITLVEYDDAYRYRIEDLFSESSKEWLLANPRKEINRLLEVLKLRDKTTLEQFEVFGKVISMGFWLPKVKKAFRKALEPLDFSKLQMDEADMYYCLNRDDYDYGGLSIQQRMKKYLEYHKDGLPRTYNITINKKYMDSTLREDLQAVADKTQTKFSVTVTVPPVEPTTETVEFVPSPIV